MAYRIAMLADTHLGFSARCRIHPPSGLNERVRDGYMGLRTTVEQIVAAEPDVVLHGGDLFHRSHPGINDIAWARRQLEVLSRAGIPVYANTGNHDFANERGKQPATAAVHDPDRGITMVTEPMAVFSPLDGLNVHLVSHLGLMSAERSMPEPVDGEVNILVSHGAAQVPGHPIFACVDSPGEAVIGYDALSLPWNITLLGHYHGMDPLPGFNSGGTGQAWYAGSLLRRGFSDPPGGRGWLLVTVNDDGTVTVERRFVDQRPQFDLPFIDAAGLTGADVEEQIRAALAGVQIPEAILRQRVVNCSLPVRRGVDTASLALLTEPALTWQLEFTRPALTDYAELTDEEAAVGSLTTASAADLPSMWAGWFDGYADSAGLAETLRPTVAERGAALLEEVSVQVETGADAAPAAAPDANGTGDASELATSEVTA
jgi:hypothetical protein